MIIVYVIFILVIMSFEFVIGESEWITLGVFSFFTSRVRIFCVVPTPHLVIKIKNPKSNGPIPIFKLLVIIYVLVE